MKVLLKRRGVIVATTSLALIGASILVRNQRKNRQLAERAADCRIRAEQGNAKSQWELGSMYYYGSGVHKDYVEAVRWYRESAAQGDANGEYSLAHMYHDGIGLPQDDSEAARWCRKAAEQNNALAQYALGVNYWRGRGVPQDYAEAVRWYRKSAEQGYAQAEYALGYVYYHGYGVSENRTEANRLFHLAAAQGNEEAERAVGWKGSHSAISKIMLPLEFLGALCIVLGFLGKNRAAYAAAAVLMCSFVMDLFWYSYLGHLQSSATLSTLYFSRHFAGGVICVLLLNIVFPKATKAALILATFLFIGFIVFQVFLCELRHVPVTIRMLCFAGGPFGMAMTSAIFLRVDQKKTRRDAEPNGNIDPLVIVERRVRSRTLAAWDSER